MVEENVGVMENVKIGKWMMESVKRSCKTELDGKDSRERARAGCLVNFPFVRLCVLVGNSPSYHELPCVEFAVEVWRTNHWPRFARVIQREKKLLSDGNSFRDFVR